MSTKFSNFIYRTDPGFLPIAHHSVLLILKCSQIKSSLLLPPILKGYAVKRSHPVFSSNYNNKKLIHSLASSPNDLKIMFQCVSPSHFKALHNSSLLRGYVTSTESVTSYPPPLLIKTFLSFSWYPFHESVHETFPSTPFAAPSRKQTTIFMTPD
ncbi:hypothetical protein NPIL_353041 [Nephila pilipes]|uniref:Uncharacterized protein n=1 Tax=Nephila pilipes TaxID=299642 RepID=A0A8X6PKX1_NEPPI|nr:hypothetical protein NPIL_353041 [Nephila pilipes]